MCENVHKTLPTLISGHDLGDLVSTVTRLDAESRKQGETLARLTDEQPSTEPGSQMVTQNAEGRASVSGHSEREDRPGSIFILALEGTAYVDELEALARWVNHLLLPVYGREITTGRPWCQRWQEHPEAVARLHALWLAWQQLTDIEAGLSGPSVWHRDHLDHALSQLRSPEGAFSACTTNPRHPSHRILIPPTSGEV